MSETPAAPDPDDVDEEKLEEERAERLDPEHRPDNAEVDNTGRTFDQETGYFTDSEGADDAPKEFATSEEDLGSGGEDSERA